MAKTERGTKPQMEKNPKQPTMKPETRKSNNRLKPAKGK